MFIISDGKIIIDTEIDNSDANKDIDDLNKNLSNVAKNGLKVFAGAITAIGKSITTLSGATVKIGMDFEAQMSRVMAIAGATSEEVQKLTNIAISLGASTSFSSTEVVEGMENIASAGFSVAEIIQVMPGMLDLATSSGETLASSAAIAANILRGFGLEASYAGHVADVLAKNAADTNAAIIDTGYAMKYIAPVARTAGWSLESVTAAIGAMADAGIKGEQAGTTLRGVLTSLMDPAKPASEAMEAIGFSAYNASGSMKPLSQIITEINEKTKNLTDEQKNQYIAQIFGTEVLSGMMVLLQKGGVELDKMTESLINSDGAADKLANTMQDNLKGNIEQLGGALETLAVTAYQKFEGPMRSAVKNVAKTIEDLGNSVKDGELSGSIKRLADNFSTLISSVTSFVADIFPDVIDAFSWIIENGSYIASVVAAIGTAFLMFNVVSTITNLIGVLKGTAKAIGLVAKAQAALDVVLAMSPIGWVIIGVTALVAALVVLWNTNEKFRNAIIEAWNEILDAGKAVWEWLVYFCTNTLPNALNTVINFVQNNWQGLLLFLVNPFLGAFNLLYDNCEVFREFINNFIENVKQTFINGWDAIANFFIETVPIWIENIGIWFNQLPEKIGYALGYVLGSIVIWGLETYTYFVTNVPLWIESIGTWFSELPDKIWTWLLATATNIAQWGLETYTYLVTNVPLWIESIGTWFSELPGKIWTWLVVTATNIAQWGLDTYNNMQQSAMNSINSVVGWFSSMPSRIWEWLLNTIYSVIQFKNDLGARAREAGSNMVSNIVDSIINLPNRMLSIGENIVRGVWEGITGLGGWLKSNVSGFFGGIVDGAKAALGIQSPSRVFKKEVGKFIPLGVEEGYEDEMPNVQKNMQASLARLTANMKATVDYETARTTTAVVARNSYSESSSSNSSNSSGISEGSVFILKNDLDGESIGETVYKVVNGKLAIAGKRRRG